MTPSLKWVVALPELGSPEVVYANGDETNARGLAIQAKINRPSSRVFLARAQEEIALSQIMEWKPVL